MKFKKIDFLVGIFLPPILMLLCFLIITGSLNETFSLLKNFNHTFLLVLLWIVESIVFTIVSFNVRIGWRK
jgi:hypothetical protein